MCGKPNHGDAEECVHCGARLKPLEAGGDSEESGDWLERMREEADQQPASTDAESSVLPEPEMAGEGEPELDFDSLRPADEPPEVSEDAGEQVPEWLKRIRQKQAEEPSDAPATDEPAPEDTLRAEIQASAPEPDPASEFPQEAAPEEREDLAAEAGPVFEAELPTAEPSFEPEPTIEPELGVEPEPTVEPEPSEPSAPPSGESPDWLSEMEEQASDEELPHVPALIGGEEDAEETELGDLGLPDWLGEIEPLEEEEQVETPSEGPDLAPATLPNWLEAMRPVDTFRSVVEIEAEEDQAVESVGPLAGLSGVLLAEPVVAMPRTSSVGSMQLDVSERQYAQAELLHRLVDEEEQEAPVKPVRRTRLAIFRWAIAGILLLAVTLPIVTGAPTFELPGFQTNELRVLYNRIEELPSDQTALVVFDYEPGNSGELEAVAGGLLDQLMSNGTSLASISTNPTGSSLAVRAVETYVARHGYENGQNIVHMGYLSGGPTAVQLFAISPRAAVLKGFALPDEMKEAGEQLWDSPVLSDVQSLSDFSLVAVVTANSEAARVWAEQAKPNMGQVPLLMVLSAPAEPLIRPYFEGDDPKVVGILSGLRSAVNYEAKNGRFGQARERWDATGSAMFAAQLVLLAGVGYGALIWWGQRSQT